MQKISEVPSPGGSCLQRPYRYFSSGVPKQKTAETGETQLEKQKKNTMVWWIKDEGWGLFFRWFCCMFFVVVKYFSLMILLLTRDDWFCCYFFYAPRPLLQVVLGLWFKFWVSKQLGVHRVFGALGVFFFRFFLVCKIIGALALTSIFSRFYHWLFHWAKNIPWWNHRTFRTLVNEIGFRIDVQFRRAFCRVVFFSPSWNQLWEMHSRFSRWIAGKFVEVFSMGIFLG